MPLEAISEKLRLSRFVANLHFTHAAGGLALFVDTVSAGGVYHLWRIKNDSPDDYLNIRSSLSIAVSCFASVSELADNEWTI